MPMLLFGSSWRLPSYSCRVLSTLMTRSCKGCRQNVGPCVSSASRCRPRPRPRLGSCGPSCKCAKKIKDARRTLSRLMSPSLPSLLTLTWFWGRRRFTPKRCSTYGQCFLCARRSRKNCGRLVLRMRAQSMTQQVAKRRSVWHMEQHSRSLRQHMRRSRTCWYKGCMEATGLCRTQKRCELRLPDSRLRSKASRPKQTDWPHKPGS
mmetsp:Transcript_9248/g.21697  ORF Transcript_9248/g.21697 Transcript_9248/m.21697 type:complete len:206 (-) Transcript_9248:1230-1847(-)